MVKVKGGAGELAVFEIRKFGDPVLRRRADEVESVDASIRKLMQDMRETMEAAPGVGLAAPQIGILRRVIVWHNHEDDDHGALANPAILESRGSVVGDEGCLSLPGLSYPVARAEWVLVEGLSDAAERVEVEAEGLTARIFQHEIDHIDGVLFIDRIDPDLQREARKRLREQALGGDGGRTGSAVL
jgi:peptide deformylase